MTQAVYKLEECPRCHSNDVLTEQEVSYPKPFGKLGYSRVCGMCIVEIRSGKAAIYTKR